MTFQQRYILDALLSFRTQWELNSHTVDDIFALNYFCSVNEILMTKMIISLTGDVGLLHHFDHYCEMRYFDVIQVSVTVQSAQEAGWEVWTAVQLPPLRQHREIAWCASKIEHYVTTATSLWAPILLVCCWQQWRRVGLSVVPVDAATHTYAVMACDNVHIPRNGLRLTVDVLHRKRFL